jgi:hypothetical protein
MTMDSELLVKWWNAAWDEGLWAAAWGKSLAGLTAEQAAWKPGAGRHSIWQNVLHMLFWREHELRLIAGEPRASKEQIAAGNFPEPAEVSAAAWEGAVARLKQTQERIGAALRDPKTDVTRIAYLLPHDCYHFGQINLLRGLQGLASIE